MNKAELVEEVSGEYSGIRTVLHQDINGVAGKFIGLDSWKIRILKLPEKGDLFQRRRKIILCIKLLLSQVTSTWSGIK